MMAMMSSALSCSSLRGAVAAARPTVIPQPALAHALSSSCARAAQAPSRHQSSHLVHTSVASLPCSWTVQPRCRPARSVRAAARSTPTEPWWTKDNPPNMVEAGSVQEFVDLLADSQDKLVIVEFFAPWCNACKSLFPKLCKIMGENPDTVFIKVNFEENKQLARTLGVKVLPFFHFYKGAEGRVAAFSCSISKIQLFRDALETHSGAFCNLEPFSGLAEFPEVEPHAMSQHVPTGFEPIQATQSIDATSTVYETLVSVDSSADSLPMPASLANGARMNGANGAAVGIGGSESNGAAAAAVRGTGASRAMPGSDAVKVPDAVSLEVLASWRAAEVQGSSGATKQPGTEGQLAAV